MQQNPIQSAFKVGDRVRALSDIVTVSERGTETDAEAGDAGTVIQTYAHTDMVTVQWPKCVSDAHPLELERMH